MNNLYFKDPIGKFRQALESAWEIEAEAKREYQLHWADKNILGIQPHKLSEEEKAIKEEKRYWIASDFIPPEEYDPEFRERPDPNLPKLPLKVKNCFFCNVLKKDRYFNGKRGVEKFYLFNSMNVPLLSKYISGSGSILPQRVTGNCSRHQRKVSKMIKKAVHMGFFSWKGSNFTINSPFKLPKYFREQQERDPFAIPLESEREQNG